ncbi:46502_t:CDS:2, partial [Gigaspora margarita]
LEVTTTSRCQLKARHNHAGTHIEKDKVDEIDNVKGDDSKVKKDNKVNEIDKIEVDSDVYNEDYSDYEKYDDVEAVGGKDDQNDDINDENHSDYEEEYNDEVHNDCEEEYNDDDVSEDNDEEEFRYDSYEFILSFLTRYGDYVSEIDIKNKFMEADNIMKTTETITSQHEDFIFTEKVNDTEDLLIIH